MNIRLYSLLAIFALSITLFSCKEDEDLTLNPNFTGTKNKNVGGNGNGNGNNNGGGNTDQFMKATVNGQLINFPVCEADTFGFWGSEFELNGEFPLFSFDPFADHRISFEVYDENYVIKADTTYSLDSNAYFTAIYEDSFSLEDSTIYFSETGQIRFSVATPSGYEGTFSFTAKSADDSKNVTITNGTFKAVIDKDM